MLKIESDQTDVKKTISDICEILEKNGAYLAPFLTIEAKNGNISLLSDKEDAQAPIIKLPHTMTLPYDEFTFAANGDDIVMDDHTDKVSDLQLLLMEKMLTLYNLTGKLKAHKETCPWVVFQNNPEILDLLFSARQGDEYDKLKTYLQETQDEEAIALDTFFKTRLLGRRVKGKIVPIMMPVIDFTNHHGHGATYKHVNTEQGGYLSLAQAHPVSGSRECFASYGRLDSLDTYLGYGFMDSHASFVRSIPVEIDLGALGKIKIGALNAYLKKADIPDPLQDLKFYFPTIDVDHQTKRAELSHIYIPQDGGPMSMRRILDFVLLLLDPEIDQAVRSDSLLMIENAILKVNKDFYNALNHALNSSMQDAKAPHTEALLLKDIAQDQSEKINIYQSIIQNIAA